MGILLAVCVKLESNYSNCAGNAMLVLWVKRLIDCCSLTASVRFDSSNSDTLSVHLSIVVLLVKLYSLLVLLVVPLVDI